MCKWEFLRSKGLLSTYLTLNTCISIYMYTYILRVCACVYVCMYVVCMCKCMYVYACTYKCIYIYIHLVCTFQGAFLCVGEDRFVFI